MRKFQNTIFMTKTVKAEIPWDLILFIVSLVQNMPKDIEVDYLQVIDIQNNTLIHKQEEPEYHKEYTLKIPTKKCKLFFIDNGEYSTLMFSHEY